MQPVLHLIDKLTMEGRYPSSCAMMIARWAAGLRRHGYAVDAAVLRPRDAVAAELERAGLPVLSVAGGSLSPRSVPRLVGLIRERGYRLLHLHGYGAANYGRVAAHHAGVPAVVHEHAVLPLRPHQWVADRLLRGWTDAAVAVSGEVRAFMIRVRSIPPQRIRVIANGIDLGKYACRDTPAKAPWRARLGVAPRTPLIGTVTRLHPLKGNSCLVKAAPSILARYPSARIVIAGDGPERGRLEKMARDQGVGHAVIFAGFVADPATVYAALDVFVLPSLQEGFGLAALEAMAAGRAVVVSSTGGLPRLVNDGVNGLLSPPGDARALADRVIRLLDNPDEARRLAERGRQDSRTYGIDRTLEALAELYGTLI